MVIDKYTLGMAGEYAVCSELLRRGIDASITMGNAKATDVVVFCKTVNGNSYKKIEVKTTQTTKFVTNFFNKYYTPDLPHPDIWILVHIDRDLKARFFILTHEELASIQMERNNINIWQKSEGCDNVLLKDIEPYENMWDKILLEK